MARKLTPKQDAFVAAYIETGNASEAYRRAYNVENMLSTTVGHKAHILIKQGQIAAKIAEIRERAIDAVVANRANVLSLLTDLAFGSAADIQQIQVRNCRYCWGRDHRRQWKNEAEFGFALAEAIDGTSADMAQWERDTAIGMNKPQPASRAMPDNLGGFGFDVTAQPNPECPFCLGEGHVTPVVKDTRLLKGSARRLYAGFKHTQNGLELKTRDQDAALRILANEFGIGKEAAPVQNVNVGVRDGNVTIVAVDPLEAARQYQELMKG